jgi:hypothetical protein
VEIFEVDQMVLSVDSILRVVSKALLKACVEVARETTMTTQSHFQFLVDVLFVRQAVCAMLSAENANEIDHLGDQALSAADGRCVGDADAVPEGLSLLKCVSDGLAAISNKPTLFQR